MNRAVPTVIVSILSQIRQLGRGSNTLCVGAFALSLVNLSAMGGQQTAAVQPPNLVNPPAIQAAVPAQPKTAPPAAEALKETPKPVTPPGTATTATAPAPIPAPKTETPALAPTPAPAPAATPRPTAPPPPKPNANDEMERLKKTADLMVKVNEALGMPQSPYGKIIYDIAVRHSINPHLVAALIHVESAFNPRAKSSKGAYGLMQLLPETARRFGLTRKKDLYDPKKNLEAGIRYLAWLADRFGGDAEKILAAYNAGEGAVERYGGIPPYQETQSYVQKIFGLLGFTMPPAPVPDPSPAGGVGSTEAAAR
ncbi:MAG TPA: lytic transglycosylase domain-containing protein [Thermoanaerobaculia bacterium]|nr:lytic transglycosylase domain-containing protein [Thermoanaerobaculia bacterium]